MAAPSPQALIQPFSNLKIPAEFGTIDKVFIPQTSGSHPVTPVIYIQDAHANPGAQRSIANILETLYQERRISGIGLEGAFGNVNPGLIRLFDDAQANQSMVDYLAGLGELTGAEIFGYRHALPIQGLDDPQLYEASFQHFTAVKKDPQVQPFLSGLLQKQETAEQRFCSQELQDFVRSRRHWNAGGDEASAYFKTLRSLAKKHLRIDLGQAVRQFEYPQLFRIIKASEMEAQFNPEKARLEIESLRKMLAENLRPGAERQFFVKALKHFEKEPLNPRFFDLTHKGAPLSARRFFEKLYDLMQKENLSLLNYPALLDAAGLVILQSEMDAPALLKELRPLELKLEDRLARTAEARKTLQQDHKRNLIEKMLTLTLSLEDYRTWLSFKDSVSLENVVQDYEALVAEKSAGLTVPAEAVQRAAEFYRLSVERDDLLADKGLALSRLFSRDNPEKAAVWIAGGFHKTGMLKFFETHGVPYVLITPKIGVTEEENFYEKVMLGENVERFSQGKAEMLNPRVLLEARESFRPEAVSSGRRPGVMLGAMLKTGTAADAAVFLPALRRAELAGFFARVDSRPVGQGESAQSEWSIPETGWQAVFSERPDAAAVPAGVRSEVRILDQDAERYLGTLQRGDYEKRVRAAIERLDYLKQTQIDRFTHDPASAETKPENFNPLMAVYGHNLPETGPPRIVSVIEELMRQVYDDRHLIDLPLPYRAAFVMAALDQHHFPEEHAELMRILDGGALLENSEHGRLPAPVYMQLMHAAEREHTHNIDQDILMRVAVNRFIIDLPRQERRALEREALILELQKELHKPGTGDLPTIVFMTDLHGGRKVGDLVGAALGLKHYRGITSIAEMERRLAVEKIDLESKNILFVGMGDYVDRGPKPYWGFEFIEWLRNHGKLKFINGNHDIWKDWNLFGMHLRVNDALGEIAETGRLAPEDVDLHAAKLSPFITEFQLNAEAIQATEQQKRKILERFLSEAKDGFPTGGREATIQRIADALLDLGSNPNHSLEWWSREWFEHAKWADVFLDQINEIQINQVIAAVNRALIANPNLKTVFLEKIQEGGILGTVLGHWGAALVQNLQGQGRLFSEIDASDFAVGEWIAAAKIEIQRLKDENTAIRKKNELLAAEGRHAEKTPQHRVPTLFPQTSAKAAEILAEILAVVRTFQEHIPEFNAVLPEVELVTPANYRSNKIVQKTALWNMKNFRLIYVDIYGNAYLHGMIPISKETDSFDVKYKGRIGVEAIELIQYDVRRFFEKYDEVPDTAEFRNLMNRELGEAFRILNDWYSDATAALKTPQFEQFLNRGGPSAFSYDTSSAYSPRAFDPTAGIQHVGHIDLEKMRGQGENGIPYWTRGMNGGVINGDHDISEEYTGLGAIITHMMRTPQEGLTGIRRFGYDETVVSVSKKIKALKDTQTKKQAAHDKLIEPVDADQKAKLAEELVLLQAEMQTLNVGLGKLKEAFQANGGETIKDITLFELPESEMKRVRPFISGRDLAVYYHLRFLKENAAAYSELIREAGLRGNTERAEYYSKKEQQILKTLRVYSDPNYLVNFKKAFGLDWYDLSEAQRQTMENFHDLFSHSSISGFSPNHELVRTLRGVILHRLEKPYDMALAILNSGMFVPGTEEHNLTLLHQMRALLKGVNNVESSNLSEIDKHAILEKSRELVRLIERSSEEQFEKMRGNKYTTNEYILGRQESLYRLAIPVFKEMGRAGLDRLVEFLEPQFPEIVQKEAETQLRGGEAVSYLLNVAMRQENKTERTRLARSLDKLGSPGMDQLLFLVHHDQGLAKTLEALLGDFKPTYQDLLGSELYVHATTPNLIGEIDKRLGAITSFRSLFQRDQYAALLKNWGISAVTRWARDPAIRSKLPFFSPLYTVKAADRQGRPFVDAVILAEEQDDPEFTREVLSLLMCVEDLSVVRGMVSLIVKDPSRSHLITFLIAQVKVRAIEFQEDDFIQEEISKLLYSDIGANYYLIRRLAAAIPHARRAVGNERTIREIAQALDEKYLHKNSLIRYLRLQLHSDPLTSDAEMIRTTIDLLMGFQQSAARKRPTAVETAIRMEVFRDVAREEVLAAIQGETGQRLGQILLSVMPGPDVKSQDFLDKPIQWQNAAHKETPELETAKALIELLKHVDSRYGKGRRSLSEADQARVDNDPAEIVKVLGDVVAKRKEIKKKLLQHGVFDPDNKLQVTKTIEYKRHIADREWGFKTTGYYATYREDRFELFEEDRGYDYLGITLQEQFLTKRLPVLLTQIQKRMAEAKKLPADRMSADWVFPEEAVRDDLKEIISALNLLMAMMEVDDVANHDLIQLNEELSKPGLDLLQISNILSAMQDEIKRFFSYLIFEYGDYGKQVAQLSGLEGIRRGYRRPGDEKKAPAIVAARVQESMLAEVYAEERSVQLIGKYLSTLQRFTGEGPMTEFEVFPGPATREKPRVIHAGNFTGEGSSGMTEMGLKSWKQLQLQRRGYPVPPLAVLPASLPRYIDIDVNNPEFRGYAIEALLELERATGQVFPFDFNKGTDAERRKVREFRKLNNIDEKKSPPLIISIRSGSFISMPGMMDTAMNAPFNETVAQSMIQHGDEPAFVYDTYRRFLSSYGAVHLGIDQKAFSRAIDRVKLTIAEAKQIPISRVTISTFNIMDYFQVISAHRELVLARQPDFQTITPFEQVLRLTASVYKSWDSEGARNYRSRFHISPKFGTSVTLQQMVYGNMDENSGSTVIDSSHPESSQRKPFGNFKFGSQGTELVSGLTGTAQPFSREQGPQSLESTHPALHRRIADMATRLERQEREPQNLELTVQEGKIFLLQARPQVIAMTGVHKELRPQAGVNYKVIGRGRPVTSNAAVGRLLNARHLSVQELIEQVGALRTQMNAAGEDTRDIILVYDYFTDDDSSHLLQLTDYLQKNFTTEDGHPIAGSIGILNSKISESNHASLIAMRLGLAYVGKVDTLDFDPENQIVFGGEVFKTGMEGPILAIDGHSPMKSTMSGQVILGDMTTETDVRVRSEVRELMSGQPDFKKTITVDKDQVQLGWIETASESYYGTRPYKPFDIENPWLVQRYLAQVYNTLADVARAVSTPERTYGPHEVQVHDEVVASLYHDGHFRSLIETVIPPARFKSGFVDSMDLFRMLAKFRQKTEMASYPVLKTPSHNTPEKIALVVDAKVSDLEAAFFRDLIGNPDIALEAVVGTTPVQLAATLNHSIYRRFLRSGDVRYDQKEGWIEILGRRIPVVKNEEEIKGDQWRALGVHTFVATHPIRRRAEKIAAAVAADSSEESAAPVRIIALENLNPFTPKPVAEGDPSISLGLLPGDMAVKMESSHVLLRSSLLDVPVRFLKALEVTLGAKTVQSASFALNYSVSPMNALPLDESGRVKSPVQNQIPVSAEWTSALRAQMRSAFKEAKLPAKALKSISMSSIPAMMGDRTELALELRGQGIDELLQSLGLGREILKQDQDYSSAETKIREKLLSQLSVGLQGSGFVMGGSREAVNTDTRFNRQVLVDNFSVQVTISQAANGKLELSLSIPLVFNRDWQNSRHLTAAVLEVAREEAANEPVIEIAQDFRLSPFGAAVDYAKRSGTLPPAALEIPETLPTLREKPLQIGVVGFAGQIGARLHALNDLNLNIAAAIGGKPLDIRHAFDDSIVGPFMSHGLPVPIVTAEFSPHEDHRIGLLKIGEGREIVLLRRYDDPRQIPWKQFGVEVVAETTGAFTDPTDPRSLLGHLEKARGNGTGAEAVLLSAPFSKPKDADKQLAAKVFPTVVFGVNDSQVQGFLKRAETEGLPKILSNASCTTNCVATMTVFAQRLRAAVTKMMRGKYGLKSAELGDVELAPAVTVHALTNTQPGFRDSLVKSTVESRHRAGPQATITKSGVSDAIVQLKYEEGASFAEGATGYAVRVPIATSLAVVPFIFKITGLELEDEAVLAVFNQKDTRKAFQADVVALYSQVGREMAADPVLRDAVAFGAPEDAFTSEIIAGSGQMVIDAQQVHVLRRGDRLTVTGNAWYDNVTNYSDNFLRVLRQMADAMPVQPEKSADAKSEVRALFGWGKRAAVPVSDDLIRARLSTELALLGIEEGPHANVNALLPMVRAVLEEYTDFEVKAEMGTVTEQEFQGTTEMLDAPSATNSMVWMGGAENILSADMWKEVEVQKLVPKIVGAGQKRSEVRALFGWGKRAAVPVSDDLIKARLSTELALLGIEEGPHANVLALLPMVRAVLEEYTDFEVKAEMGKVTEREFKGTSEAMGASAATNSMMWSGGIGDLLNEDLWEEVEVQKLVPKIVGAGQKRSEVRALFGWGKRAAVAVSDDLIKARLSTELALLGIEEGPHANVLALLPMVRAVLEEYTDFEVKAEMGKVTEREFKGTSEAMGASAATNSMMWTGGIGDLLNEDLWEEVEVQKLVPKIVGAGQKRSEVRTTLVLKRSLNEIIRIGNHTTVTVTRFKGSDKVTLAVVSPGNKIIFRKAGEAREPIAEGEDTAALGGGAVPRTLNVNEWIQIGNDVEVHLIEIVGDLNRAARISIEAERAIPVMREEVYQAGLYLEEPQADGFHVLKGAPHWLVLSNFATVIAFRSQRKVPDISAVYINGALQSDPEQWKYTRVPAEAVIRVEFKAAANSEVRLQAVLEPQGRSIETLLAVAQIAALNTVEPPLAAAFPGFFQWRLFGLPLAGETVTESPQLPALRQALSGKLGSNRPEQISEMPKTVVLASINGQIPVVDLEAMQLGTGSRVVILDSRGAEPVVWKAYEGKLPKNVRVERGVFEGQRPDLPTLQSHLTEKGADARDEASRAILVFPYVTETVLDQYAAIPLEDGLVVRAPRLARKSATLRFAFSYFLGRGMRPAQLLKETPPDVFQVRVHSKSLSPAYVPLGSEGHFAAWAVKFAARELLESAA